MIIWGSKGKTKVKSKGSFLCPVCKSQQRYEHHVVGKYFTLYFIPLFKTKTIGEYIECKNCYMTFKPEVLDWSRGRAQAQAEINEVINDIKEQLNSGVPIEIILHAFLEKGFDKDIAGRLLMEATNNRLNKCTNCDLAYSTSISYCPQCGSKLTPKRL